MRKQCRRPRRRLAPGSWRLALPVREFMLSWTNQEIFKQEKKLMSKKVKVLISILVAALLLTMGGVTMVMAEGEEETTPPPPPEASKQGLLERMADILEIDREALIDAFKQAEQEIKEEVFINRLNQAVAEGRITQEQADEIREWWELRPDDEIREWWELKPEVIKPGMVKRALRFRASPRFHMRNGTGGGFYPRLPGLAD